MKYTQLYDRKPTIAYRNSSTKNLYGGNEYRDFVNNTSYLISNNLSADHMPHEGLDAIR